MQLAIELSQAEEALYLEARQILLQDPEAVIEGFLTIWLRVVGEIGAPAFEDMPRMWLLAVPHVSSRGGKRDAYNLKLAHDCGRPWDSVPFDPGYRVLDEKLTDRVLAAGIKDHGMPFVYNFDSEQVDYKFQELLLGQIYYPW